MLSDDEIDKIRMEVPPSAGIDFDVHCRDFARAIIAAHNAKLLAGVMVEFPCHPEPHTYRWSRLEEEVIKQYAAAAALNARREALDEAKAVCKHRTNPAGFSASEKSVYDTATLDCTTAIETLKGKV